jgi:hypothetical protein
VATWTGFDSENLSPEGLLVFNMLMSVGQAERERNRLRRQVSKDRAATRGVWCAPAPVGYDRDEDGHLHRNGDAEAVRLAYSLRAGGIGYSEIARRLPEVTIRSAGGRGNKGAKQEIRRGKLSRSNIKHLIESRTYLGDQVVPNGKKGQPRVIEGSHEPLVTVSEWESANAVEGQRPRHTGLGAEVAGLHGRVKCGSCGGKLAVVTPRAPRYQCSHPKCPKRAGYSVKKLEDAVDVALSDAFDRKVPEVMAVAEGGQQHEYALEDVERASEALAEWRDSVELQRELGMQTYVEGLKSRKAALELARKVLRELGPQGGTIRHLRESSRAYVAEVKVYPLSAPHRLTVTWTGATEPEPLLD